MNGIFLLFSFHCQVLSPLSFLKELHSLILHIRKLFLGEIKTCSRINRDGPQVEL